MVDGRVLVPLAAPSAFATAAGLATATADVAGTSALELPPVTTAAARLDVILGSGDPDPGPPKVGRSLRCGGGKTRPGNGERRRAWEMAALALQLVRRTTRYDGVIPRDAGYYTSR